MVKLVSNTDQTVSNNTWRAFTVDSARSFTAGDSHEGYMLTRADVEMRAVDSTPTDYTVSIYGDSGTVSGTSLGTLTNPASLTKNSLDPFTASGDGIDLDAQTTYWVLIDAHTSTVNAGMDRVSTDGEESGASSGWNVGNDSHRRRIDNETFRAEDSHSLSIDLHGKVKPADMTAPVLEGAAVTGATVTLPFDEDLDTNAIPATRFCDAGTASTTGVTAVAFKSGDASMVELTLSPAVAHGDTGITVSYAKDGDANPLKDDAERLAAGKSPAAEAPSRSLLLTGRLQLQAHGGRAPCRSASPGGGPGWRNR